MYNLSTDYEELWSYVIKGHEPVCFVDSILFNERKSSRAVAMIKRHSEKDIDIGVRGRSYGGVTPFDTAPEKELFISECKRLNLQWVRP